MSNKKEKSLSIATNILNLSIREILINYRFFNMGLDKFKYQESELTETIGTNGEYVLFNADYVIERYINTNYLLNKIHIHMLYHCLLKHPFQKNIYDEYLWNIACDIAVSFAVDELNNKYLPYETHPHKDEIKKTIQKECPYLTAQHIYKYISQLDKTELRLMERLFILDDHSIWKVESEVCKGNGKDSNPNESNKEDKKSATNSQNKEETNNNESNSNNTKQNKSNNNIENNNIENEISSQNEDNDSNGNMSRSNNSKQNSLLLEESLDRNNQRNKNLESEWEDINSLLQLDLKTFSRSQGIEKGYGFQMLKLENKDKYDYTEFLNKFAVYKEEMKIDMENFDYIFYTFGLSLYKNMPLIEPLEYKDSKKIYQFVIAIDTSGSVWEEDVKRFLDKTYSILKSKESFHRRMEVHIIQCDTEIQDEKIIHSQEEFESYRDNYEVKGGGGTDFRPVFVHIDNLIKDKQLSNLKGLIYFTDGYGEFPEKRPKYETAFIFFKDAYTDVNVPPWAIKLILDPSEL